MRSLLLLLLFVSACVIEDEEDVSSTASELAVAHRLRIATFNIHGGVRIDPNLMEGQPGFDIPGYDFLAQVMSEIRAANADVVLIQEVNQRTHSGGCDDQPVRLAGSLGDLYAYSYYAPDTIRFAFSCGSWSWTSGQMILSKLPLQNPQASLLVGDMQAVHAIVVKDGVSFHVYTTHFSRISSDIVAGFQQLRSLIDQTVGEGIVLAAGDFNWSSFADPVTQAPMASRPLFHHGDDIDHLWSDWPSQNTEVAFPLASPIAASDHALRYWDLTWIGDDWISMGQKRAWGFGTSGQLSSAASGYLYGRNDSIPARVPKLGLTSAWAYDTRLGHPPLANPGYALTPAVDGSGCEFVGWRDTTFKWALESGASCAIGSVFSSPGAITSAPGVASFSRWLYILGHFYSYQNYLVFTTLDADGTLAWSHYEGTSPPGESAFTKWNIHTDGAAKASSSPAVVTPISLASFGGCAQIFIRDRNDRLQTKSLCYDGTYRWSGWTNLDRPAPGVSVASNPSAAAAVWDKLHACVIGSDAQVWCKSFSDGAWDAAFRSCGAPPGGALGDPSVTMDGSDVVVHVRGRQNRVYLRRCNRS